MSTDLLKVKKKKSGLESVRRKSKAEKSRLNPLSTSVDHAVKGFTFNYSDEINAATRAGARYVTDYLQGKDPDFGKIYDDRLRQERDTLSEQADRYPVLATTAEVGGGIASGGNAVGSVAAGAKSGLELAARASGTGQLLGAIAGFGDGENLEDRTERAGGGAVMGGVLPLVSVPVAKMGHKAWEFGLNMFAPGLRNVDDVATRKVVQAMDRDGGLERVQARMRNSDGTLYPVDAAGKDTRNLAHSAMTTPGGGGDAVQTKLNVRQMGQSGRVEKALDPVAPNENYFGAVDDMVAARSRAADELYERVADMDAPLQHGEIYSFSHLEELIKSRPAMAEALKEAQDFSRRFGKEPFDTRLDFRMDGDEVVGVDIQDAITTRTVDRMKKAYDRLWKRYRVSDPGRAAAYLQQKHDLLEIVDDLNPAYKAARSRYADESQAIEAMESGLRFFKGNANESVHLFEKMSPDEKGFFKRGVMESIRGMLDGTQDTADSVRKLLGKPGTRKRLAALFDNLQDYHVFMKKMLSEARKSRTRSALTGGSPTDPRQAARVDKDAGMSDAIDAVIAPANAVRKGMVNRAMDRAGGINARTSARINEILFSRNPEAVSRLLAVAEKDEAIARVIRASVGRMSGAGGVLAGSNQ